MAARLRHFAMSWFGTILLSDRGLPSQNAQSLAVVASNLKLQPVPADAQSLAVVASTLKP